jgi:hypothetical protein
VRSGEWSGYTRASWNEPVVEADISDLISRSLLVDGGVADEAVTVL